MSPQGQGEVDNVLNEVGDALKIETLEVAAAVAMAVAPQDDHPMDA